ncbi:DUF2092 domain-containing protein [Limibaculum sp. FT325]|uniref:DUF2092 domain-containing protein n=1 Tax=Thermohalobaculum sediminis TaxID=2939436 RepID=UPI0020C04C05|nr:DUF2092 domain-containing protein [Limibaculum sediminis]MCL5776162.1 DUF2092 domain-containing protein [Limibaculum sediminis]
MSLPQIRYAAACLALSVALPLHGPAPAQQAPVVDDLVRSMTATLADATSITLHVEKMFDELLVTGEKINYAGAIDIALRRPDRFHVSYGDDLSAKEVWYDGSALVLLDLRANVHGNLPAAATIDATLDAVAERYGLRMPLASLLSSDAYAAFADQVVESLYIGLHDVDGTPAHHLYFTDGATQWQVWIDAGEVPLPLKLVVTYLDEPGEPQSIFLFTDWDLAADLPDDLFTPQIPEGAALAAFLPRQGE